MQKECTTMDWRHKAVCRDEDPELFFPVGNSGPALAQIADAKLVCNRCPVTTECLTWALESGQDAGVWGGLSEDERRALKRRNARARGPQRRITPQHLRTRHSLVPGSLLRKGFRSTLTRPSAGRVGPGEPAIPRSFRPRDRYACPAIHRSRPTPASGQSAVPIDPRSPR